MDDLAGLVVVEVGAADEGFEDVDEHLRVGAGGEGALLGAAQLGRRDHLHGLGDLPRVFYTADAAAEIEDVCHGLLGACHRRSLILEAREEVSLVLLDRVGEALAEVVVEGLFGGDVGEDGGLGRLKPWVEAVFEGAEVLDFNVVEEAVDPGEEDGDLPLGREGLELGLLEEFGEALAAVELVERDLVEVGAELGEGGEFAVLGEIEFERCADLLGGFVGGGEAYA